MLTVSDELKNAFMQSERTIYVRIKVGNRTFDNDNVVSVDFDSGSLSGEVFAIGSTYSNSIKITFSELVEGLKELDEVSYEIGIKLSSGAIEYVPMGIFIINDAIGMDRNNNKTTIECMDKIVMMGGTYASSLTYPAAIREVALEIANKAGVVIDSTSFARLSADKIAKPEGYTYREAIGLIAQFEAGFATFNKYGKLEIRTLSDPNFAIPPDNYFSKGLVKNEVFFRLGGISCVTDYSDTTIQSGNTAGNQIVLENRVMTKTLLDKIYQKIQTINYYPFSLNWQGNPVLEAGDWVVVEDLQGNKFKTPNLNYSLSFSGGLTANSSAETATQSDVTYGYKSQLQQKIEWIYAQIDAAGGNLIFEGIDEPSNPKEGDLWFKIIGPDKQILIFKKKADGTLFWEPQISTADINKVAEEVNKIIDQANKDRTKAEQEINQALADAKNYTEVKAQEFDNQLLIVNQNVLTATNSANAAVARADQAVIDAGFAKVDASAAKISAIDALNQAQSATNNVSTLSFNIDELTKTVGFKAEKTVVDAVTKKVDQHTLDITANAQAISARLTSAQVDNLVTGKGYVNQTALNATSSGLTAQITQVSNTLNNLDIGGRNYARVINRNNYNANVSFNSDGSATIKAVDGNSAGSGLWAYSSSFVNCEGGEYVFNYSVKSKGNLRAILMLLDVNGQPITTGVTNFGTYNAAYKGWFSDPINYNRVFTIPSTAVKIGVSMQLIATAGLSDTVNWLQITKGNKIIDYSPAPEDMATLEKVVTIEANIQGIQATVANKAEQSQVTQLAGQIQTKVESAAYNTKMTQLDSAINLRVTATAVTEAILSDKKIKDTRSTNESPAWYFANYPQQTVEEFKTRNNMGGIPGTETFGQLTTKVPWTGSSGGAITQIFSSKDGVFQRTSNALGTAWLAWDQVAETGKIVAQINLSTEGVLIQGKVIQLDGQVNMDAAFINKMKAFSIEAVYADIATLKTRVLTANVIDATMINATTALITKLFATDANVNILTAKTAFINSVKAIDIAADRITAGTLNAALVNIINLNASRITTGVLSGISITSPFNYIYSGTIRNVGTTTIATGDITMNGTFSNGTGSTYLKLNADGLYGDNLTQTGAVRSLFKLNGDGITVVKGGDTAYYRQDGVYFESGGGATIKYYPPNARIEIGSWNGVSLGVNSSGSFYNRITVGGGGDGLVPFVDIWTDLNLRSTLNVGGNLIKNAKYINGVSEILFADTSNRIVQGSSNVLSIMSPVAIDMGYTNGTSTSNSLTINNAGTTFAKAVQFNGNAINGANNINNAQTILFHNTSNRIVQASDGQLNILAPTQINLGWTNGSSVSNVVSITNNQVVLSRTLNMNGNSITNQSDSRLKKNIVNSSDNSLEAISRWKFVDYEWKDSSKPKGIKFGLIAQDTPELSLFDALNDIYNIDSSKQIMLNSHAIQQINQIVVSIDSLITATNSIANNAMHKVLQVDNEVQQMKNKIVELEKEIKSLKGAA